MSDSEQINEPVEYDYMARSADLFDFWQSPECSMEEKWIEGLIKSRPIIQEICAYVTNTGLFKDSRDKHDSLKAEWEKIEDLTKRLNTAYYHFLDKVATAPTRMHARGVVILCLPLLLSTLDQYTDGQKGS